MQTEFHEYFTDISCELHLTEKLQISEIRKKRIDVKINPLNKLY